MTNITTKLRTGDEVVVLAGRDVGKTGTLRKILKSKNKGIVTGVNDIAISPTQRQRDQLYRIAVNPVTQFPAEGIVVFGQKTLQRKPTAFDRVPK